jgi:cysteine desulfurase
MEPNVPEGRLYLDHAATTPILPEARQAMADALARWHNPSSPHAEGRAAKAALEDARARIAAALGWGGRIIFTSGASEALSIALRRAMAGSRYVSPVEHDAVMRIAPGAARLPIGRDGIVRLDGVEGQRPLIVVQHANNETGVIQPIDALMETVRGKGGILLADCAQTAGKLPLPDAHMIALSAHKFGGPPGVGALLLRDFDLIEATGGQEQGYRAGTENLPGIVGMTVALEAGRGWMEEATRLRARLDAAILSGGGEIVGRGSPRISTIAAYCMPGVPSNAQLIQFDMAGIAVSAGSACSSGSLKASHVLAAMGWQGEAAQEIVRASFGRGTSEADVDRFASLWAEMAGRRRAA